MPLHAAFNTELLPEQDAAPEWVELIPAPGADGMIRGRDGRSWKFGEEDGRNILQAFTARNADLPIDWEHATQHRAPKGEPAPAAGWITSLAMRAGALWGRVAWTPRGGEQVLNREYRYLSPVFDFVSDTRRIVRLVSAGLANLANLHLQALNQEDPPMSRPAKLTAAITTVLALGEDAADDAVASAINQLKTDRDGAVERATNAEKAQPSLDRYVPRADYDAVVTRAANAEDSLKQRDQADHDAKVDAAIKGALEAGKITPATEDYHRAACSDTDGLKRFQAFVGAAPAVGDDTGLDKRQPAGKERALNAEQKEACRLLGIPESDYAAELAKE